MIELESVEGVNDAMEDLITELSAISLPAMSADIAEKIKVFEEILRDRDKLKRAMEKKGETDEFVMIAYIQHILDIFRGMESTCASLTYMMDAVRSTNIISTKEDEE